MYDPVGVQEAEAGKDVAHVLAQRLRHAAELVQVVLQGDARWSISAAQRQ